MAMVVCCITPQAKNFNGVLVFADHLFCDKVFDLISHCLFLFKYVH